MRRSWLARRVALRRAGAVTLAALVAWGVTGSAEQARRDRERWGPTRRVVVATRDIAAGAVVDSDNATLDERPVPMVPQGALREVPVGRRVRVDVPAGEALLSPRLAGSSQGGLAARLPDDGAAVTFPLTEVRPALTVGDRVDVYASVSDVSGTASARVAAAAEVIGIDDASVTVAVAGDEARGSAAASLSPGVAIVVRR